MTNENIHLQALLYEDECHNPSVQKHFEDGAEWARNEVIDRACKWLHSIIGDGFVRYGIENVADNDQFEAMFRNAMEG